jgi:hypothetical protein
VRTDLLDLAVGRAVIETAARRLLTEETDRPTSGKRTKVLGQQLIDSARTIMAMLG